MIKVYSEDNIIRDDIVELWHKCFGDTIEYICFFLDNCPEYECITEYVESKLVSMYFLLDGFLAGERCKYLYAACTHPDFRKQGIMERLIDFGKEHCTRNGFSAIFLVPANENLYSYYSKFGFISSFRRKIFQIKSEGCTLVLTETDIEKIFEAKKILLDKIDCFRFSDGVLKYTIREHLYNGGKVFLNETDNSKQLAFFYEEENNNVVKEFLSEVFNISVEMLKVFCNKNTENIYICTPLVYNSRDIVEKYTKCGMCLPLNNNLSDFLKEHTDIYAGMYLD